jgi:hypothetical protein
MSSLFTASVKYNSTSDKEKIMAAVQSYVGEWESEIKTDQNGNKMKYSYELTSFDESNTMFKMVIKKHYQDGGAAELVWEGFKGWNPGKEEAYYYGFSPSGRFSSGILYVNDEILGTYPISVSGSLTCVG